MYVPMACRRHKIPLPDVICILAYGALGRPDGAEAFFWQGCYAHLMREAVDTRTCLGLACDLFLLFSARRSGADFSSSLLDLLKQLTLQSPSQLTFEAAKCLFQLLDGFNSKQDKVLTPLVYRTIVCALIERGSQVLNSRDPCPTSLDAVKDFIVENLCNFLEKHDGVPVGVLIEPLVKQLKLMGGLSVSLIDLFVIVAKHPRLQASNAMILLDFLGQTCFLNIYFSRAATLPFLVFCKRFGSDPRVNEYVEELTRVGLSYIVQKPEPARNLLIVELLAKVAHLQHPQLSCSLKQPLMQLSMSYLENYEALHPALETLLAFWPRELRALTRTYANNGVLQDVLDGESEGKLQRRSQQEAARRRAGRRKERREEGSGYESRGDDQADAEHRQRRDQVGQQSWSTREDFDEDRGEKQYKRYRAWSPHAPPENNVHRMKAERYESVPQEERRRRKNKLEGESRRDGRTEHRSGSAQHDDDHHRRKSPQSRRREASRSPYRSPHSDEQPPRYRSCENDGDDFRQRNCERDSRSPRKEQENAKYSARGFRRDDDGAWRKKSPPRITLEATKNSPRDDSRAKEAQRVNPLLGERMSPRERHIEDRSPRQPTTGEPSSRRSSRKMQHMQASRQPEKPENQMQEVRRRSPRARPDFFSRRDDQEREVPHGSLRECSPQAGEQEQKAPLCSSRAAEHKQSPRPRENVVRGGRNLNGSPQKNVPPQHNISKRPGKLASSGDVTPLGAKAARSPRGRQSERPGSRGRQQEERNGLERVPQISDISELPRLRRFSVVRGPDEIKSVREELNQVKKLHAKAIDDMASIRNELQKQKTYQRTLVIEIQELQTLRSTLVKKLESGDLQLTDRPHTERQDARRGFSTDAKPPRIPKPAAPKAAFLPVAHVRRTSINTPKIQNPISLAEISTAEEEGCREIESAFHNALDRLFRNYQHSTGGKQLGSFDAWEAKQKMLQHGEVIQLLRDFDIIPTGVSKLDVMDFLRKTTQVSFVDFVLLLRRLACTCFENEEPQALQELGIVVPPPVLLAPRNFLCLLQHLLHVAQKATSSPLVKVAAPPLMQGLRNFTLRKIKQEMHNLQEQVNAGNTPAMPPGYRLNQGIRKVPADLPIPLSERHCTEILDSLLGDIFGIHFLTPDSAEVVVEAQADWPRRTQGPTKRTNSRQRVVQQVAERQTRFAKLRELAELEKAEAEQQREIRRKKRSQWLESQKPLVNKARMRRLLTQSRSASPASRRAASPSPKPAADVCSRRSPSPALAKMAEHTRIRESLKQEKKQVHDLLTHTDVKRMLRTHVGGIRKVFQTFSKAKGDNISLNMESYIRCLGNCFNTARHEVLKLIFRQVAGVQMNFQQFVSSLPHIALHYTTAANWDIAVLQRLLAHMHVADSQKTRLRDILHEFQAQGAKLLPFDALYSQETAHNTPAARKATPQKPTSPTSCPPPRSYEALQERLEKLDNDQVALEEDTLAELEKTSRKHDIEATLKPDVLKVAGVGDLDDFSAPAREEVVGSSAKADDARVPRAIDVVAESLREKKRVLAEALLETGPPNDAMPANAGHSDQAEGETVKEEVAAETPGIKERSEDAAGPVSADQVRPSGKTSAHHAASKAQVAEQKTVQEAAEQAKLSGETSRPDDVSKAQVEEQKTAQEAADQAKLSGKTSSPDDVSKAQVEEQNTTQEAAHQAKLSGKTSLPDDALKAQEEKQKTKPPDVQGLAGENEKPPVVEGVHNVAPPILNDALISGEKIT